jgi:hypothetical protein
MGMRFLVSATRREYPSPRLYGVGLTHFILEDITMAVAVVGLCFFCIMMVYGIYEHFFLEDT